MQKWLRLLPAAISIAGLLIAGGLSAQEAPASIKVGYVLSLTGPQADGALLTTAPNYRLWVDDVNKAGGLMLKKYGKRIPIEVREIDDRSDNVEMVRHVERLMRDDKADIVLSPWGTGPNLQAAPTFHKYGYPQIMGTAGSNDTDKLVERFPTMFWFLGPPAEQVQAVVDFLSERVKQGVLQNTVAMFTVQHPFGTENGDAARLALAKAGFKIVYETGYPLGFADLSEQIQAAKAAEPDILLAWSYPPDTFLITEQALANDFNPKFKLVSVGGAFPTYKGKFGNKINGWFSLGGLNLREPAIKAWCERHKAVNKGAEPDRWASANTYAGLEALQQAIERVGEIDRPRILRELQSGTFQTIIGEIRLKGNRNPNLWHIGQWQNGEFYGVAPADRKGARAPLFGK
jgi:branched-chain amino acid transport system substrate-binding protein